MERETSLWKVHTFDVWGNETDGFEVNGVFTWGTITLPNDPTDEEILAALKEEDFVKPRTPVHYYDYDRDTYENIIEIKVASNRKPAFQLLKQ